MQNKLKTKVNNLGNKIPDAPNLIHTNQYDADKQSLKKNIEDVDKKIPDVSALVTTIFLNTKISKVEIKIPDVDGLVKNADHNAKISDIMRDCFITSDYNNFIEEILAKLKQANLATNSDANAVSQCANKRKEKT